jgi:hypothetical protein
MINRDRFIFQYRYCFFFLKISRLKFLCM